MHFGGVVNTSGAIRATIANRAPHGNRQTERTKKKIFMKSFIKSCHLQAWENISKKFCKNNRFLGVRK